MRHARHRKKGPGSRPDPNSIPRRDGAEHTRPANYGRIAENDVYAPAPTAETEALAPAPVIPAPTLIVPGRFVVPFVTPAAFVALWLIAPTEATPASEPGSLMLVSEKAAVAPLALMFTDAPAPAMLPVAPATDTVPP